MPLRIIAEVGSNWYREDKSEAKEAALKHIRQAAKAGATGVKFQVFRADSLYSRKRAPKQWENIKRYELPLDWLIEIKAECEKQKLKLWLTPFSPKLVSACRIADGIKIASGDITYHELLWTIKDWANFMQVPVLLSTGAATSNEIANALTALDKVNVTLLQCVVKYPALPSDYRLDIFPFSDFANNIGISDHTTGNDLLLKAIDFGYTAFEKHVHIEETPDNLPDRSVSMNMSDFALYCGLIRELFKNRYRIQIEQVDHKERVWARRGKDGLRPAND